jgi:hypothetical protein
MDQMGSLRFGITVALRKADENELKIWRLVVRKENQMVRKKKDKSQVKAKGAAKKSPATAVEKRPKR